MGICVFQLLVVDIAIGSVPETLQEIERTNCKLPDCLDELQMQWRERQASIQSWAQYFQQIGASRPAFPSTSAWIADCVRRAACKGPKYGGGGSKGFSKGSGKGGWKAAG